MKLIGEISFSSECESLMLLVSIVNVVAIKPMFNALHILIRSFVSFFNDRIIKFKINFKKIKFKINFKKKFLNDYNYCYYFD